MRRRGLCGSGLIAEASAAVSRARVSTICWSISTCHVLGFFAGAVLDYSAGFSLPMPDAETSISEEPGARKGHAGICAGAVRATGRPTAMLDTAVSKIANPYAQLRRRQNGRSKRVDGTRRGREGVLGRAVSPEETHQDAKCAHACNVSRRR